MTQPRQRLPEWLRRPIQTDADYSEVQRLLKKLNLHTVCESAHCPNRHECWNRGTATIMILGDICTRNCGFCAVATGCPGAPDPDEPQRVAAAVAELKLRHVVITSVTRDDLPDGGASVFAATIRAIKEKMPQATVEVLTPDFQGSIADLHTVLQAEPDVFNHNLETVERLQPEIRPQASYRVSLDVLGNAAAWDGNVLVKSGIMLGLGETDEEVFQTLEDLYNAGCRLLTIGQYLAPSREHLHTKRFVPPAEFQTLEKRALEMGFSEVAAGPLVRSSYRADRLIGSVDD
ncbi:MAG: lipoyl synthase [Kiritimatiellales bacterium]|nr:lipoyl synthase [Kiritimatiellales bacterium]